MPISAFMLVKSLSKSRFNPSTGIADFWQEFRKPQPYRIPILIASALPIGLILYWATEEQVLVPPAPPEVTYITSFAPDRSDEEIIASNIANQERQDALQEQRDALAERKKELYRELGRATGIDVDAMEEQIEAERAAEESADAAAEPASTEAASETGLAE